MLRDRPALATGVALLLGAVLRLSWGWDIEYKSDEHYSTEAALGLGNKVRWPRLGMISSVGIRNPGMSVWVFSTLAQICGARGPVGLARGVQVANITALVVMLWFALSLVPTQERELWLWATALAALCPVEVLYDRKIWAQSLFPLVCMFNWIAWWHRRRPVGALAWGLIGAILGQIQMSGFFFGAALVLWTTLFGRAREGRVCWGPWFAGSLLGMIALVPWLQYLWSLNPTGLVGGGDWGQHAFSQAAAKLLTLLQFWVFWVGFPLGWNLLFSLGGKHFIDFLAYPVIADRPTYGVLFFYVLTGLVGVRILHGSLRTLWGKRGRWKTPFNGISSECALMISAAFYGYGLLLAISPLSVYPHYVIVVFPMQYVGLSWLVLGREANSIGRGTGRVLLLSLCIAEFLMSVLFLYYIHINGGAPDGDYGHSYGVQYVRN
jgi:hypothetical protein